MQCHVRVGSPPNKRERKTRIVRLSVWRLGRAAVTPRNGLFGRHLSCSWLVRQGPQDKRAHSWCFNCEANRVLQDSLQLAHVAQISAGLTGPQPPVSWRCKPRNGFCNKVMSRRICIQSTSSHPVNLQAVITITVTLSRSSTGLHLLLGIRLWPRRKTTGVRKRCSKPMALRGKYAPKRVAETSRS